MDAYLKSLQLDLKNINNKANVTFVIGNESCDLDSAVSAIVYAYFLHTKKESSALICPLLQVSKVDLALRTDAVFCMQRLKLSLFDVPCVEDVNFNELSEQHDKGKTRLKIILVDHNNIFDKSLESKCLTEIIDHHQRYKSSFGENVKCTIDMVGSCATLVIDQIWEQDPSFQDYHSLMLCRFAIITDTVNFSEEARKTTDKDREMIEKLDDKLRLALVERSIDYELILNAKQDTRHLTVIQCLRKDLKIIRLAENDIRIAMSSHMELCGKFLRRNVFEHDVETFLEKEKCQVLIVMGLQIENGAEKKTDSIRRDILILPSCETFGRKIVSGLKKKPELGLTEKNISLDDRLNVYRYNAALFEQGDVSYSRKKIMPIIEEIFTV